MNLQPLLLITLVFTAALLVVPGRSQTPNPLPTEPKRIVTPDTPQNALLVDAMQREDFAAVQAALRQGASADTQTGWEGQPGLSPVTLLAAHIPLDGREKLLPIFRLLVQNISAASAADTRIGPSLLSSTVYLDDIDSMKCLVAKGADVNARPSGSAMSLLHSAIEQGVLTVRTISPITEFLLSQGVQINTQDGEGLTPLMLAARLGNTPVVRALLARGADPALRDKRGWTALRWAAVGHGEDVIGLLRDCSPMDLSEAAQFGDVARLRTHLDAGENPNTPGAQGTIPLMAAMKSGSMATARLLLDRGADVNGKRPDGTTALHLAALYGDTALVGLLLDRGADINAVAHTLSGAKTPLTEAVTQAQADIVALLLKHGVDLKHGQGAAALESAVREAGNGLVLRPREVAVNRIPHGEATYDARGRIIDLLLNGGADVRADGSRALFLAARAGQAGLVELLLSMGANVNAIDTVGPEGSLDDGQTALIGAIESWRGTQVDEWLLKDGTSSESEIGHIRQEAQFARRSVGLLLAHGADTNRPDTCGKTPLMQCVSSSLPDLPGLAEMLLARGAKVNVANPEGRTALMEAAAADDLTLVALLLLHHADVNRRDKQGKTALMLAIDDGSNDEYRRYRASRADEGGSHSSASPLPVDVKDLPNPSGHPEVVRLLLQHGAAADAVAQDGTTALSLAHRQGFGLTAALLTQAGARR